jgi:hypothetical protein
MTEQIQFTVNLAVDGDSGMSIRSARACFYVPFEQLNFEDKIKEQPKLILLRECAFPNILSGI